MTTVKTQKRREYGNELDHLGGFHRKVGYVPDLATTTTTFLNMFVPSCQIPSVGQLCRHLLAVFGEGRGGSEDDLASWI